MPERYPCGQCDLDFNFRIKLNRHIARVHTGQSDGDTEPHYLKFGVSLTDEDKLKHFDDLKSKFNGLCNKYTSYEKRFDYLQTKLRSLTQRRNKPKKMKVKKLFAGSSNASGSYEDIEDDPTIPAGWKSSYKTMDVFGSTKSTKHKIYWAPNGRFCSSRREALNYMMDLQSTEEDVDLMKKGLLEDGWFHDSSLPKGWFVLVTEKEGKTGQTSAVKQFITSDMQYCKTVKLALKYLVLHNSDHEISKFISGQCLKNEVTPSNISWLQSDSIPYPWKAANTTSDTGAKGQILVSPEGNIHTNLKTAIEIIEKSKEINSDDIKKLFEFMGDEKYKVEIAHNDWNKDESLPEGWMKLNKPGHAYYLSPKGETFGTRIGVMEYLKRTNENFLFDEKPLSVIVKKELNWKEDETAPNGWTTSLNEESALNNGKRFKDPQGKYFFNRVDALRFMVKEHAFEEEDVAIMKAGLIADGWSNENMPEGWVVKNKTYLSPTYEQIPSLEQVIRMMRDGGISDDEIVKVKENSSLKWKCEENLPEGWMVSRMEGKAWFKRYMNPNGKFFLCLPQALKHLCENDGGQATIDQLKPLLTGEGWCIANFLPEGWLYKLKDIKNRFMFLSPKYNRFKNTKMLMNHMRENNMGQQELQDLSRQIKALYSIVPNLDPAPRMIPYVEGTHKIGSNSSLNWMEAESLPSGWKLAITEISTGSSAGNKYKRFLSPKGEYFGKREEAFRSLLMDASADKEDIDKMRTLLIEDGWDIASFLPENWLRKVDKWNKNYYLTPTGDVFANLMGVLKYMTDNGYSVEEMGRFKENCLTTKYTDDKSLPYGWKCGLQLIRNGLKVKRYLSPEGIIFNNRALAMKYMLENKFNSEDIIKMKHGFDLDGWLSNENLPEGWKMKSKVRKAKPQYLTPSYDTIDGGKAMIAYLVNNNFSSIQINKFQIFLRKTHTENRMKGADAHKDVKLSVPAIKHPSTVPKNIQSLLPGVTFSKVPVKKNSDSGSPFPNIDWKDNESLPAGWKISYVTSTLKHHNSKKIMKLLSPDGKFLNSRAQALRYMLEKKDNFRNKDIEKMKKNITKDGWRVSEHLPSNWMFRPVGRSNLFLNPKFEQIKALKNALTFMEKKNYDSEIIERVRKGFFRVSREQESMPITDIKSEKINYEASDAPDIGDDESNESFTDVKLNSQSSTKLDWKESNSMPKGWKFAYIPSTLRHHAEDAKITKFMSPDGKYLGSRVQCLKYMKENETKFSNDDIKQMKSSLLEDGWKVSKDLPEGWMYKPLKHHPHSFMTPEFDTLRSNKKTLEYMQVNKYDSLTIDQVKAFFITNRGQSHEMNNPTSPLKRKSSEIDIEISNNSSLSDSIQSTKKTKWNKYTHGKNDKDWTEGDDTVPKGWKIRIEKSSTAFQMLSPSRNVFRSRAEALKFMVTNPNCFGTKDIIEIQTKLHHEDWEKNSLLPEGWLLKKLVGGVVIFLSEKGSCMKTVKGARDNIKRNDMSALGNFTSLVDELKPTNRKELKGDDGGTVDPLSLVAVNYNNIKQEPDLAKVKKEKIEEADKSDTVSIPKVKVKSETLSDNTDSSIPPNWVIKTSPDGLDTTLITSQGKTFSSRLSAVEFLIKSKSDPQTIYNLWNTLDTEGWNIGGELLPPGWRVKFHKKVFDYKYLTREMAILHSTEEAITVVRDSGDYIADNVDNFKQWSEEVSKSKPKITWIKESSLPDGWMLSSGLQNEIIKDGKGALFAGRKEAIDHMIKEHYSPSDIFSLWNTLHLEGWINDEDNLPTGWKRKFFSEFNKYHYLSPMMDVVKSTEALLTLVKDGKEYTEEEIGKVKNWLVNTK